MGIPFFFTKIHIENHIVEYEGEFINGEKDDQESMDQFRNRLHKYKCLQTTRTA